MDSQFWYQFLVSDFWIRFRFSGCTNVQIDFLNRSFRVLFLEIKSISVVFKIVFRFLVHSFSQSILKSHIGFWILEIVDPLLKIISISGFVFRKTIFDFWFQNILYFVFWFCFVRKSYFENWFSFFCFTKVFMISDSDLENWFSCFGFRKFWISFLENHVSIFGFTNFCIFFFKLILSFENLFSTEVVVGFRF